MLNHRKLVLSFLSGFSKLYSTLWRRCLTFCNSHSCERTCIGPPRPSDVYRYKSFTDAVRVVSLALPGHLANRFVEITNAQLIDMRGRRDNRYVQAPYMDEADFDIHVEEQGEEDACLLVMEGAIQGLAGLQSKAAYQRLLLQMSVVKAKTWDAESRGQTGRAAWS